MNRYSHFLTLLILLGCMAGCGGESSSTEATTIYETPSTLAPASTQMGGSIQKGTALSLSTKVTIFAGSIPGFTNHSTATQDAFNHPISITTNDTDFYVADYYSNAIRKISKTRAVSTIATDIYRPTAITMDASNLYVFDSGNYTIKKIVIDTGNVTTLAGTAGTAGSVDAVGTAARFNRINGITTDGVNLFVSDSDNTIRRVALNDNNKVTTLAGAPGKVGSADGITSAARFNQPAHLTTDGIYLYVADFNNATIRKIDILTGEVKTLAGVPGNHGMVDTAPGVAATFYHPNGITTDGTYLYVTDYNDTSLPNPQYWNVIRKIEISSGTVTTIAGGISPTSPNFLDDDLGTNARFASPIGITTDGTSLYVADSLNNLIRKIQ